MSTVPSKVCWNFTHKRRRVAWLSKTVFQSTKQDTQQLMRVLVHRCSQYSTGPDTRKQVAVAAPSLGVYSIESRATVGAGFDRIMRIHRKQTTWLIAEAGSDYANLHRAAPFRFRRDFLWWRRAQRAVAGWFAGQALCMAVKHNLVMSFGSETTNQISPNAPECMIIQLSFRQPPQNEQPLGIWWEMSGL